MNAPAAPLPVLSSAPSIGPALLGRHVAGSARQLRLAFALVAVHAVAVFAGIVSFAVIGELDNPLRAGWKTLAMLALITTVTAGGVIGLGVVRSGGASLHQLGWRTDRLRRDVAIGLLAAGPAIAIVVGLATALGVATPAEMLATVSGFSLIDRVGFACIGLSAAFTEESLFRGYLQPGLRARLGAVLAIVVGAAVFSVYHLDFRVHSLLIKCALGMLFAVLREATDSLTPCAIAHFSVWAVLGAA